MQVLVISGSPKGKNSVTLQSAIYLEKYFDENFEYLDVGAKINFYKKDFSNVQEKINNADIILICYPVYTCLATSQLHTFFELMESNGVNFMSKPVAQITTSKHFYDMTAHRAVENIINDFSGKYVLGLSQDMNDLTTEKGRLELVKFWKYVLYSVQNNIYIRQNIFEKYNNSIFIADKVENIEKTTNKTVALVTNLKDNDANLKKMIDTFIAFAPFNVKVFNISDMNIKGGCLGCLNCAGKGICVYQDGFPDILRNDIETLDGFVWAFSPRLHTMGADFKTFDDRRFCNGHRSMSIGKPCAFISGRDLYDDNNLFELLEARAEIAENYMCGIATPSAGIENLKDIISRMDYALNNDFSLPQNFYGVGGRLIFRDLVYIMQGIMRADYKFYNAYGFFNDLPHKQKGTMRLMKLAGWAMNNKKIKAKMGSKMDEGMLIGHKKAIEKIPEDKVKFKDK